MIEAVLSEAAERYGLRVSDAQPVASFYREAAVFRLQTDRGPLCLKPFRYPEHRLRRMLEGLDHLQRQGFRRLAPVLAARDGSRYFRCGGQLYLISRWVAGTACDLGTAAHRCAAADSLGAFHLAARGCAGGGGGRGTWPERYGRLVSDLKAMAALAAAGPHPLTPDPAERERCEHFDRLFARWVTPVLAVARTAADAVDSPAYRRLAARAEAAGECCHGDFVAPNLVIDPDGRAVLIDLDTWSPEIHLYDLAKLVTNGSGWQIGQAREILAAYTAHRPLAPEERELLPAAVQLPREFWWAGVCRYRRRRCDAAALALLELAVASLEPRATFVQALRADLA